MKFNLTPELLVNILCGIIRSQDREIERLQSSDMRSYTPSNVGFSSKVQNGYHNGLYNAHREIRDLKVKNHELEQELSSLKSKLYSNNYIKEGF